MEFKIFGMAAIALLLLHGRAEAETSLVRVPYRFLVVPPTDAGSKRVTKGEFAFEFPLRWENAAVLSQDVKVAADERQQTLRQGQSLVETELRFTDPSFAGAKSFCVPRTADPSAKAGFFANSFIGNVLSRSLTDGQFCIVDRDGDGLADHSVLVNAGSPTAREPQAIDPVSYSLIAGAIVSEGDSVKLRYRGGRDSFELQIVEQGRTRLFQTFEYQDQSGHHRFDRWLFGEKIADGTYLVEAPGLAFKVSGYDPANKSVLIEWSRTEQTAVVPIPDDVKIRHGYGY